MGVHVAPEYTKVISKLVREALTGQASAQAAAGTHKKQTGFLPFPTRGFLVTDELIDRLRDAEDI
jgi:hypothetical protein